MSELTKLEGDAKAFEKVLAQKVTRAEDAIEQKLSAEEELVLRRLETEFLKARIEIENFQKKVIDLQKQFGERITMFAMKYNLDPTKLSLDPIAFLFRKMPAAVSPTPPVPPVPPTPPTPPTPPSNTPVTPVTPLATPIVVVPPVS